MLQAVLGNAQLGLEDVPEGSPAAEFFQEIVKAGSLAQRLVAKLLTYARQRTPQQQVVDLSRCVQDALSLLRLGLPPEVRLAAEVAEDVGQIWDEPTNVHQLILNLGTNAIAAVADRGQVRVSLQLWESKSARPARFGQICVGQYARLSVSDDGEGMSAEVQARIFQPFFTTREAGHGTGLGLAVVAEIVRTQHGAIDVRSTLGEGTSIEVYLPLLSGQEAAMRRVDDVRPEGTEAIAVIDDDPGVLLVAKSFLDRLGYRTTHYSSARPFLQDLETRSQSFDVVVTDLSMPGFSGIALAQHLAQNHPSLPVILTSGFDEPLQTVGSAPPTVRAILRKPYGAVDIGRVIRRVLKQTARG